MNDLLPHWSNVDKITDLAPEATQIEIDTRLLKLSTLKPKDNTKNPCNVHTVLTPSFFNLPLRRTTAAGTAGLPHTPAEKISVPTSVEKWKQEKHKLASNSGLKSLYGLKQAPKPFFDK